MSLQQALYGVRTDLVQVTGLLPKIRRLARLSTLMVDEFVGTLRFVRYGIRALGLYREIGHFSPPTGITHPTSIVYDASYGPKPRNLVDVYTPCGEDASSVVLFVHGGVWCSGEKWQYAPIAKELSMQGVLTCVMSYTLFPHAMARDIAAEVNVALDWVMDNVAHPCSSVTVVGHSAGAHSVMMAMLDRTKTDKRMPDAVIGMCGVYDIATHYEFERGRDVHELSTMKRAMGGCERFDEQSPTRLLSNLFHEDTCFDNMEMPRLHRLPQVTLITSTADTTVPSSQSRNFCNILRRLGAACRLIVYPDILHAHFATIAWTDVLYQSDTPKHHSFVSDFLSLIKKSASHSSRKATDEAFESKRHVTEAPEMTRY